MHSLSGPTRQSPCVLRPGGTAADCCPERQLQDNVNGKAAISDAQPVQPETPLLNLDT
jgi:hypothetical protein